MRVNNLLKVITRRKWYMNVRPTDPETDALTTQPLRLTMSNEYCYHILSQTT